MGSGGARNLQGLRFCSPQEIHANPTLEGFSLLCRTTLISYLTNHTHPLLLELLSLTLTYPPPLIFSSSLLIRDRAFRLTFCIIIIIIIIIVIVIVIFPSCGPHSRKRTLLMRHKRTISLVYVSLAKLPNSNLGGNISKRVANLDGTLVKGG